MSAANARARVEIRARILADMGEDLRRLADLASEDLYTGTVNPNDDYPGFTAACSTLARYGWCDVYYNVESGELSTSEADVEDRDDPDNVGDWLRFETRDVKRAVLGELAAYV